MHAANGRKKWWWQRWVYRFKNVWELLKNSNFMEINTYMAEAPDLHIQCKLGKDKTNVLSPEDRE